MINKSKRNDCCEHAARTSGGIFEQRLAVSNTLQLGLLLNTSFVMTVRGKQLFRPF